MNFKFHFDPVTKHILVTAGLGSDFEILGELDATSFMIDMNNAYIRMDRFKELKVVEAMPSANEPIAA